MMLLWISTVHVDKSIAIACAIHFYNSQQKILIFVLETGEMWDKLTVHLILILICLGYVIISNLGRKIGTRFWNLGCKYDGWVIKDNTLKFSQEAMQLYVLKESCCLCKTFQRVLIYMTCHIHCPLIHFRHPPRRGVLKMGFLLRKQPWKDICFLYSITWSSSDYQTSKQKGGNTSHCSKIIPFFLI